eukprot:CCRYP_005581-RA/>CCRYP_005581-RA protein AED:0.03 eAED:0.03 QI:262/1/1/1/0/0/2/567/191
MLYAASSRRSIVLRHQSSPKALATPPLSGHSSRRGSELSRRPTTANDFQRFHRSSTPYKPKDGDRVKELEKRFLLTEQELNDFYRAFYFMARKKGKLTTSPSPRKSNARRSKSADVEINSSRPWECEGTPKVTLSLLDFFATFDLVNGGFYDAIFELVGIKDFHSMTFSEFLDGVLTYSFFTVSIHLKGKI